MKNLKTKLRYVIYILLVSFLMVGCIESNKTKDNDPLGLGLVMIDGEKMSKYKVIEVEGCEYILFYGNNNELRYDGITHKGNCKNHQSYTNR